MKTKKAFTIVEMVLTIALVAVLVFIIVKDINPSMQLSQSRDVQREADINLLLSAVLKYQLDTGNIPASITNTQTEVCKTDAVSCSGLVDLSVLTDSSTYMISLPVDPQGETNNGTGYEIYLDSVTNKIIIVAPHAEANAVSVSR